MGIISVYWLPRSEIIYKKLHITGEKNGGLPEAFLSRYPHDISSDIVILVDNLKNLILKH